MLGLDNLKGLFQPQRFYDSMSNCMSSVLNWGDDPLLPLYIHGLAGDVGIEVAQGLSPEDSQSAIKCAS